MKKICQKITDFCCAFLPRHVGGRTVFAAYELLRIFSGLRKRDDGSRIEKNRAAWKRRCIQGRPRGYIEDQNHYGDMIFGKGTLQASGCGVIATCNLLLHLRPEEGCDLAEIAAAFEQDGMVLGGKWGVSPGAIRNYLKKRGYIVRRAFREEEYEALAADSQGLILTMYNDRNDIRRQLHTIAVTREKGLYDAHNVYCDGRREEPRASLGELLGEFHGGRALGIVLLGVSKKPGP